MKSRERFSQMASQAPRAEPCGQLSPHSWLSLGSQRQALVGLQSPLQPPFQHPAHPGDGPKLQALRCRGARAHCDPLLLKSWSLFPSLPSMGATVRRHRQTLLGAAGHATLMLLTVPEFLPSATGWKNRVITHVAGGQPSLCE